MSAVETGALALAIIGAIVALIGCSWHVRWMLSLPFKLDVAEPKGSVARGVLYSYTLGMAPWEKESTRQHMLSYLRGVIFHLGIFAALLILVISPWLPFLSGDLFSIRMLLFTITLLGGLAGFGGFFLRFSEENLRALSTRDDYFAVALVSVFVLSASLVLLVPVMLPLFHFVSAVTLTYLPFGKVRHCIDFFFSRFAFGAFFGHRGVIEKARS